MSVEWYSKKQRTMHLGHRSSTIAIICCNAAIRQEDRLSDVVLSTYCPVKSDVEWRANSAHIHYHCVSR